MKTVNFSKTIKFNIDIEFECTTEEIEIDTKVTLIDELYELLGASYVKVNTISE